MIICTTVKDTKISKVQYIHVCMYVCFMDAVMYVLYTTRYLTSKVKMTEMYKRRVRYKLYEVMKL
jgi:hypothetical protein